MRVPENTVWMWLLIGINLKKSAELRKKSFTSILTIRKRKIGGWTKIRLLVLEEPVSMKKKINLDLLLVFRRKASYRYL